jgi:phosphatidylglycerol:prolipoprotein diacylglycerol transferase
MRPILFNIGSFPVHSFGVMMVIAFFAALWLVRRRAKAFGFEPNAISDIAFYTLIAGVFGARLVFIAQEWPHYRDHPPELFSLQFQGLTSFGGLFFGMAVLIGWAVKKRYSILRLLDLSAPAFILGHAIGRVGCLLNGCCYGAKCDASFPFGVHIPGTTELHQPAQAYDSLMNLTALAILLLIERKVIKPGVETGLALLLHGLARFIYEFWRAGESSTYWGNLPITQAQAMAIGLMLAGLTMIGFVTVSGRRQEAKTA